METERLYKNVEDCCSAYILPEEEGRVKSTKEWEALEEAYRIVKGDLTPEKSKKADEWRGLRPDVIMYYAMEDFAKKKVRSLNTIGADDYFLEDVVTMAIDAAGVYSEEQIENKRTIYDKCKNEKEFCAYFGGICANKYLDAAKKELKDRAKSESYDSFLEKGIEAGDAENGTEGAETLFAPKANEWQKELQGLLKLVLRQVAKGPLNDYDDAPGIYRNLGGAFAKYVPFLEEDFVEKGGRFELWTYEDRDVPEELVRHPRVKKGSKQASEQMYPIIENHVARSAALMFSKIINGNLESANNAYDWSEDFYDRIFAYEKSHGRVKYHDIISSTKTMENNAKALHKAAIEESKQVLEKRLTKIDRSMIDSDVLLKQLETMLAQGL